MLWGNDWTASHSPPKADFLICSQFKRPLENKKNGWIFRQSGSRLWKGAEDLQVTCHVSPKTLVAAARLYTGRRKGRMNCRVERNAPYVPPSFYACPDVRVNGRGGVFNVRFAANSSMNFHLPVLQIHDCQHSVQVCISVNIRRCSVTDIVL